MMSVYARKMPRLVAELSLRHPHPACGTPLPLGEGMGARVRSISAKQEQAIKANLMGLGYGG